MFIGLANLALAATTIVKDYPELGGINPGDKEITLPEFIKYIFLFSLAIVGIVGLLAIVIGAFGYLTAVGNPQKASDAKNKIISALLGLLLLLGSYILLNTINPDLLELKVDSAEKVIPPHGTNVKDYACYVCCSYPGFSCDPLKKPKRFCEHTTFSAIKKQCSANHDGFYGCNYLTHQTTRVVQESCN